MPWTHQQKLKGGFWLKSLNSGARPSKLRLQWKPAQSMAEKAKQFKTWCKLQLSKEKWNRIKQCLEPLILGCSLPNNNWKSIKGKNSYHLEQTSDNNNHWRLRKPPLLRCLAGPNFQGIGLQWERWWLQLLHQGSNKQLKALKLHSSKFNSKHNKSRQ